MGSVGSASTGEVKAGAVRLKRRRGGAPCWTSGKVYPEAQGVNKKGREGFDTLPPHLTNLAASV